jgi:hypothetical protein
MKREKNSFSPLPARERAGVKVKIMIRTGYEA